MKIVYTPRRGEWPEYAGRLMQRLGSAEESRCGGDFTFSLEILSALGADVWGTLDWLRDHGVQCDCDVLMNLEWIPELGDADRGAA